jgi:hypothetical protein
MDCTLKWYGWFLRKLPFTGILPMMQCGIQDTRCKSRCKACPVLHGDAGCRMQDARCRAPKKHWSPEKSGIQDAEDAGWSEAGTEDGYIPEWT